MCRLILCTQITLFYYVNAPLIATIFATVTTYSAALFLIYLNAHSLITRLEAGFQPKVKFTLWRFLAVFTRSDITPPKVNRFR